VNWKDKLLFVSAQPDVPYFHWQCEIYLKNFISLGIPSENIHVIFALVKGSSELSDGAQNLCKYTNNIYFYQDNRIKKHYIPSIKPYLIHQWLKEDETRGELFFLHDSDIIFNFLPDFESLIQGEKIYLSDTRGYLDFNYIMDCDKRYKESHPSLDSGQLLREMCDIVGVDPAEVKSYEKNSGGAQYVFKNQNPFLWYKIYKDSTGLYDKLMRFQRKYPIHPGEIQFWTAEMWAVLWNLWWYEQKTEITSELDFSWATDTMEQSNSKPILHMAGVTEESKNKKFYKGDYIEINPMELLRKNPNFFEYVDKQSSTYKYIQEMKKTID